MANPTTRVLFAIAAAIAAACAQPNRSASPAAHAAVAIAAPAVDAQQPFEAPGLHNVVTYADGLISGGVPDRRGLESLAAMGVKTVISVDGAAPDVDGAAALGMRYVHVPVRYSGISQEQQLQLAQAIASLPHPIYVHCHHGKHRSAGALGSAAIAAGVLSVEQATARMQVSGTSQDYPGLWAAVRTAQPLPAAQLRCAPESFAAVAKVSGTVALMTQLDLVFDDAKALDKAGWQPPQDHPDLDDARTAARLRELFELVRDDPTAKHHEADYRAQLDRSLAASAALSAAIAAGDRTAASTQFQAIGKSCKECHKPYRDR